LAIAVGTIVVVLVLGIKLLVGNDGCEQVRAENAILKSHRDEYLQMMADDADAGSMRAGFASSQVGDGVGVITEAAKDARAGRRALLRR
jgi:hypothetical protein